VEKMRKYELVKTGANFWELYFYVNEFECWEFIKGYDDKTTISSIYDFIKENNKKNNDIIQVRFLCDNFKN
jgi:hypothetical protein